MPIRSSTNIRINDPDTGKQITIAIPDPLNADYTLTLPATDGTLSTGGGGITWATPVDSNITLDADNTYSFGDGTADLATTYTKTVGSVIDSIAIVAGGIAPKVQIDNGGADTVSPLVGLGTYPSGAYVYLKAPEALGADYTLTFPANDGASGEFLQTDGSGVLSWAAAGGSGDLKSDGTVPMANATPLDGRNAANNADIAMVQVTAGDKVQLGVTGNTDVIIKDGDNYASTGALFHTEATAGSSYWQLIAGANSQGYGVLDAKDVYLTSAAGNTATTLHFGEDSGSYTVGVKASTSLAASYTLTLPLDDGAAGQPLVTDGSGVLSWAGAFLQLPTAAADPGGVAAGSIYYNTVSNKIKMYNGATWETVTSV